MKAGALLLILLAHTASTLGQTNRLNWDEGQALFGSFVLAEVDFRQAEFTNVLQEINRQIAVSNISIRLDFTPTTYVTPVGYPHLEELCADLVKRWRDHGDTFSPASLKGLPLITYHARGVRMLDALHTIVSVAGVFPTYRFRTDGILLAPGPDTIECRAYKFSPKKVEEMKVACGGEITVDAFCTKGWQTNYMAWVEECHTLLRVGTDRQLGELEDILHAIGGVSRLPMEKGRTTSRRSLPTVPR